MAAEFIDELFETFKQRIKRRNAEDFLQDLNNHFDGYFGHYLQQRQMRTDHDLECEHCQDPLDQDVLD